MSRRFRGRLAVLFCLALHTAQVAADAELQVSNAWIREAPPGTSVLAGYMTITNPAAIAKTITAVSSPSFRSVEIHRTVIENGMARMLSVGPLEIPAGGSVALAPGSYHLMLFEPVRALVAGDMVDLRLQTGSGPCISVGVPVVRPTGDKLP